MPAGSGKSAQVGDTLKIGSSVWRLGLLMIAQADGQLSFVGISCAPHLSFARSWSYCVCDLRILALLFRSASVLDIAA